MYAREKIQPKLYDMDQEKLARLFANLRQESLATGSYPITVRHLESMIRMSEASAKMSLREYVRADDIDLAIEVAVNSFVSAQKMSIKKTLQRVRIKFFLPNYDMYLTDPCLSYQGFRKYLTQSRDHEELLAFLLGQLVKEKARLYQLQRHMQPELISVKQTELEDRVRDLVACGRLDMPTDPPIP
jgi:DNA replication licensing factor MCM2